MMKNFIFYNLFLSLVFLMPFSKKTQAHNESLEWQTCVEDKDGDCVEINLAQVETIRYFRSEEYAGLAAKIEFLSIVVSCSVEKLQDGQRCLSLMPLR